MARAVLIRRAGLLLRSVRHTRPRQLIERLRLTARRKLLERVPQLGDRRSMLGAAEAPAFAVAPPSPVFPPRRELVAKRDGRSVARFLNREFPVEAPVDWHAHDLGRLLAGMHLHYMEYLEAVDDAAFRALVQDWIASNPPYRRGFWLDEWNSFSVSIRAVVWMQQIVARGLLQDAAFAPRARAALGRQLRFLERNLETDIGGNHLIKDIKALLWAGCCFQGDEARRWRALGERLLDEQLAEQVLTDGLHFERSPAYHAQVTADLVECRATLASGALRDRLTAALERMGQALCDLTHPDGTPSLFNDGGLHMSYAPAVVLDALAASGVARPRPRGVFALAAAGYFGARHGDDLVVVDCGAIGPDHLPAHAHGDALALEWSIAGRRAIVDTGVFEYVPGPRRARSRSTAAHNTLTLDDRDQAEFFSAFRVGRRPHVTVRLHELRPGGFVLEGSHDGFARLPGAPVHVRRFDVSRRRIVVEDRVEGGRGQRARARLLVGPGVSARVRSGGVELTAAEFRASLATSAPIEVVDAVYWPDFGVEIPTRQIVLDYGPAPAKGGFVLESA